MKRWLYCVCIAILLLFGTANLPKKDVLIVYDEPNLLALVQTIVAGFDKTDLAVPLEDFQPAQAAAYEHVILLTPKAYDAARGLDGKLFCIGKGFAVPGIRTALVNEQGMQIILDDFYEYANFEQGFEVLAHYPDSAHPFGKMAFSFERETPFGVKTQDGRTYVAPYVNEQDISVLAVAQMMGDFLGRKNQGKVYLLIKDVFAFSDLDMLCKTADQLYLANIPFIVKVMPIYQNADFNAFARYAQVLRYVASRMGSVVLTPPIVNGSASEQEVEARTQSALRALQKYGVRVLPYPTGIYASDMAYFKEIKSPYKFYGPLSIDLGIVENLPKDDQQLAQMVANLNGRWYDFGNYAERFGITPPAFLEVPYDDILESKQAPPQAQTFFDSFFSVGNSVILLIVPLMLGVVLLMIFNGIQTYNKKFSQNGKSQK